MSNIHSTADLRQLQTWFATVIRRPLDGDGIQKIGTTGGAIATEVAPIILPNNDLNATERIEIYNQQYWYRLIAIMQDEFPVLRHVLKIDSFNELAISYLEAYPSESYTLNHLCDRFPQFISEHYTELNKELVEEIAAFEYAYIRAFDAPNETPFSPNELTPEAVSNLEKLPLTLQQSAFLFALSHDLVAYRDAVWDDDEEEIFPTLVRKENYVCIHRRHNAVVEAPLSAAEFKLLQQFREPCSIKKALEISEGTLNKNDLGQLQHWFKRWVDLGFFAMPSAKN